MSLTISYNSARLAEFESLSVNGSPAIGGHVFTFGIRGNCFAFKSIKRAIDISLSLSTSKPRLPVALNMPSATRMLEFRDFSTSETLYFAVYLSGQQITAIEEFRQEKDLKLCLTLSALVTDEEGMWRSLDDREMKISRQDWLSALQALGFKNTLLYELPMPKSDEATKEIVAKAQEFIECGHYKQAVMQCRHLIENVEQQQSDASDVREAQDLWRGGNRTELTAKQRMLCMREQVKNICHLGAHGGEEFTRSQARAVLGATLALLSEPTIGFSSK